MIKLSKFCLIFFAFLFLAGASLAGFGVSPPFLKCDYLLRGSHFEEIIFLVQSDNKTDFYAKAEFSSELSQIKDWIKIDRGMEFTIPGGTQQFPLKFIVDVPKDAKLGEYKGYIWIDGTPSKEAGTQVSTMTGGTIEVDLKVTDKEVSNWTLINLGIAGLKSNESNINVSLTVQNLGNVKTRPSKVLLDVYDTLHKNILESGDFTDLEYVSPFETKEIIAKFPTKLETNTQYWGEVKIYKGSEIILSDKRRINIGEIPTRELPASQAQEQANTVSESSFFKNNGLSLILILVVIVLSVIAFLIFFDFDKLRKRRKK